MRVELTDCFKSATVFLLLSLISLRQISQNHQYHRIPQVGRDTLGFAPFLHAAQSPHWCLEKLPSPANHRIALKLWLLLLTAFWQQLVDHKAFSSPDSGDILKFIAPCYWLTPRWEHMVWRQVMLLQSRGAHLGGFGCSLGRDHGRTSLGLLWDCLSQDSDFRKRIKSLKKSWEKREGIALLFVHTVCHPYSMPLYSHITFLQDHKWLLKEQTSLTYSQSINWHCSGEMGILLVTALISNLF